MPATLTHAGRAGNHIRQEIEKLGLETKWTMAAQAAEYRQSLAIEKAIKENPAARKAWIERQLELEHLDAQEALTGSPLAETETNSVS
jgi:hypothetical protein